MAIDGKKLEEQQEVVQGAEQTESTEATQPITPIEATGAFVSSFGDAEATALANLKDAEKQREELRKAYGEALKNRTSVMGSLLQKQKPQYDEKKEKRLRNTAIAQSVGDMLSAATRGIFAFNKKGAGYVPKVEGNSALKSIEAINEMQEEYRRRNEAWRGLDLKYRSAQADAEVEAARQLLTAGDEAVEKRRKELADISKGGRDAVMKYLEMLNRNEENKKNRTSRENIAEGNNATSLQKSYISASKSANKAEAKAEQKEGEDIKLAILDAIDPYYTESSKITTSVDKYGDKTTKPKTTRTRKTPEKLTKNERSKRLGEFDINDKAKGILEMYYALKKRKPNATVADAVAEYTYFSQNNK